MLKYSFSKIVKDIGTMLSIFSIFLNVSIHQLLRQMTKKNNKTLFKKIEIILLLHCLQMNQNESLFDIYTVKSLITQTVIF